MGKIPQSGTWYATSETIFETKYKATLKTIQNNEIVQQMSLKTPYFIITNEQQSKILYSAPIELEPLFQESFLPILPEEVIQPAYRRYPYKKVFKNQTKCKTYLDTAGEISPVFIHFEKSMIDGKLSIRLQVTTPFKVRPLERMEEGTNIYYKYDKKYFEYTVMLYLGAYDLKTIKKAFCDLLIEVKRLELMHKI